AAEGERCPRDTPRRIQWSTAGKPLEQISIGIVDIDKAIARPRYVIVLFRVLKGIGDEEIAVDVLDAERSEAGGGLGSDASAGGHRFKVQAEVRRRVLVCREHVDLSGPEVGGK